MNPLEQFEVRSREVGAEKERKRIRRTVVPMVRNLRSLVEWRCRNDDVIPCLICGPCCTRLALDRIDEVTRARTK